jgi:hypothetical protein
VLDAGAVHPGRSGYAHLLSVAHSNGIGLHRVTEVLRLTGLDNVAGQRVNQRCVPGRDGEAAGRRPAATGIAAGRPAGWREIPA